MALCRQMDHSVYLMLSDHFTHFLIVAYIGAYEGVVGLLLDVFKIGKIACVSEFVKIHDIVVGIFVDK